MTMLDGYIEAAMWSSSAPDESECEYLDQTDAELADETRTKMKRDCDKFWTNNEEICNQALEFTGTDQIGHDFWLTRNGHGVGFWDRDYYPKELKDKLTDAAHSFGQCELLHW